MARQLRQISRVIGAIETRANLVEKAQDVLVSIGIDNAAIVKSRLVDGYRDEGHMIVF